MTYRRAALIGAAVGAALIAVVIGLRFADHAFLCQGGYDTLCDLSMYIEIGLFPGLYLVDIGVLYGAVSALATLALAGVSNLILFGILGCALLLVRRRISPRS